MRSCSCRFLTAFLRFWRPAVGVLMPMRETTRESPPKTWRTNAVVLEIRITPPDRSDLTQIKPVGEGERIHE